MKATAGEVYTVYNQYLKRYTACQVAYIAPPDSVSKQPWAVILSLDWVGDAPLTAEELPHLRPLYAISLLLKISDGFRTEEFRRLGLIGSSEDWERLVRGVIQEFEENNSGVDLFHFDSDEDVFCVYRSW